MGTSTWFRRFDFRLWIGVTFSHVFEKPSVVYLSFLQGWKFNFHTISSHLYTALPPSLHKVQRKHPQIKKVLMHIKEGKIWLTSIANKKIISWELQHYDLGPFLHIGFLMSQQQQLCPHCGLHSLSSSLVITITIILSTTSFPAFLSIELTNI